MLEMFAIAIAACELLHALREPVLMFLRSLGS